MKEKINKKLNEVFNNIANCDCPMWCDGGITNGIAYVTWHKHMDEHIIKDIFESVALIILGEFKEIKLVQSSWYGLSRVMLEKAIKDAHDKVFSKAS